MIQIKSWRYEVSSNKKTLFSKSWILLLAIVMLATCAGGCGNADKPSEKSNVENATSATTIATTAVETTMEDSKINYEDFLSVKMGSSLADVESILGKGIEQSSSEVSGLKTVIYQWNGTGFSNMNVTIQNDEVMGKAQVGLNDGNENVTLDMYNQVKEGMSFDEATAILGEGQLMSQAKILNMETLIYAWINSDGSNLSCTLLAINCR